VELGAESWKCEEGKKNEKWGEESEWVNRVGEVGGGGWWNLKRSLGRGRLGGETG